MKFIHIAAGLLALVAGAIALYASKGSPLHRRSGMVFGVAMLTMTSSATLMAAFLYPNRVNVVAGLLTFYLVSTGWLAVRRDVAASRHLLTGLMLLALGAGAFAFRLAFAAAGSDNGMIDTVPAAPLFMFGTIAALCVVGDLRALFADTLLGKRRLVRHLWRMSYAMLIATLSFFLGQPKVFPEPLRHAVGLRLIPVALVLGVMLYWLARMRFSRRPLETTRAGGVDCATATAAAHD